MAGQADKHESNLMQKGRAYWAYAGASVITDHVGEHSWYDKRALQGRFEKQRLVGLVKQWPSYCKQLVAAEAQPVY